MLGWDENSWEELIYLDYIWEEMGGDEKSLDKARWGEKSSDEMRWSVEREVWSAECEKCSVKGEVWSLERKVSLGVALQRECLRVMTSDRNSATGLHKAHTQAWLAHGARKFYRWERF